MIFSTGSIQVEIGALDSLRDFLETVVKKAKCGEIDHHDFVNAVESVLSESVLAKDGCVVIRATPK